jgi:elongation factor Ts
MRLLRATTGPLLPRWYSTAPSTKPPVKLIAELRKLTNVSITKAREALGTNDNDLYASLEWLQKDLVATGARTAAKLQKREAKQGLISISVLSDGKGMQDGLGRGGVRAAMVELNCETDFVGRNELFGKLAADIAHTAAFITDPASADSGTLFRPLSLDLLKDAPLMSDPNAQSHHTLTVQSAVRDLMAKVGEKIELRRAVAVVQDSLTLTQPDLRLRIASYLHGSVHLPCEGRIGALAVLSLKSPRLPSLFSSKTFSDDLERLQRALARQIAGFDTYTVRSQAGTMNATALYDQPFMMLHGMSSSESVHAVLQDWERKHELVGEGDAREAGGLEVLDFRKWTIGDSAD